MLCDGRMVCGCADPYAKRVLGDARTSSIADIWTGPVAVAAARRPQPGRIELLRRLPAEAAARPGRTAAAARSQRQRRSRGASISSARPPATSPATRRCCAPETGITRTRQAGMLDFDLFTKVIDEAGPTLGRIDFFNYGEAFLHKRAVEMCEYIKTKFPHIYLYTSTNGLAFTEEKVRQLARSGIDEVTFSIDGSSQETYVQVPPARQLRQGDRQPARAARRARQDRQRRAVRQLALHPVQVERLRRGDGPRARDGRRVRRRSPLLGDHRSSRGFVLAALRAGRAGLRAHPQRDLGQQRPRQRDSRRDAARGDRRPHRAARSAVHDPRRRRRCR